MTVPDLSQLATGLIALVLSLLASVVLVFGVYRVNIALTRRVNEDDLLRSGNRSVGLALGTIILCQALLLRHAVFPSMVLIRDLFVGPSSFGGLVWVVAYAILAFVLLACVAIGTVAFAAWLFSRITRTIPEPEELLRDNIAVGIFFAFVMLAITLIVNEGVEDLSRSLIPYPEVGVLRVPG